MKELIGKEIRKIFIDEKNGLLKFQCKDELNADKELVYGVCGDCCSESWFSEVIGVCNIHSSGYRYSKSDGKYLVVQDVKDLELGRTYLRTRQEVDEVYGILIILSDGNFRNVELLVMHRNSSNGYYGGWCSLLESTRYEKDVNFVELKEDYYTEINKNEIGHDNEN